MNSPQKEDILLNFNTTDKEEDYLFEEGFDDDEVFLDDSNMEESSEIPSRIRRTSDVIDCVGGVMSPAQIKRHSFPSVTGERVYIATSNATNIGGLNRSRRAELAVESIDLGYSSPGAMSLGGRSLRETWFRFGSSTSDTVDSDAIDARLIDEQTCNLKSNSNK